MQPAIQMLSLTKQQKQWNKQLNQHLDRYQYLRDWSELAAWLTKLKNHLQDYKGVIIDQNSLLKRLASSLNGSLPVALNESTLEIYEILFALAINLDSLQLACVGLFSFYGIANMKNKQKCIDIFTKYFPEFGNDLRLLTTGLLITVLPSLIEMHEPLVKDVTALLQLFSKNELIGLQMLVEGVWIAVLRSPNCRIPGLKYITSKLGRVAVEDDNDEEDNFWEEGSNNNKLSSKTIPAEITEPVSSCSPSSVKKMPQKDPEIKDSLKQYCPNLETLVINAVVACIKDPNILVVKNALDFLYKYMPLRGECLSDAAKMTLATSVIWLLGKRDMSVTRKINLWLFGKPDEENRFIMSARTIRFIVEPLIGFLRVENSVQPLKIIFNLYSEHDNLLELTLEPLAKEIIYFCYRLQLNGEVLKLIHRLIDRSKCSVQIFSDSLGKQLLKTAKDEDYRQAESMLHLIFYLMNRILKPQELRSVVFAVLKMVVESYTLICWKDREYMKKALQQTLEILDKKKEIFKDIELTQEQLKLFASHNRLYEELLEIVASRESQGQYQEEISLMAKLLVKVYEIFGVYSSQWVPNLIRNASLSNPQHYLAPLEVIGEAMQKEGQLKQELIRRSQDMSKNNSIKISIAKVWSILSLGHLQGRLIPLLMRLVKFFPHYFQALLDQQFQVNSQMAIRKFNLFWQLSTRYLHIVSQQQLEQICKPGLFKMLQFLDNGNPLVKYNTKIWINECFPNFHRVLNPLLQIMLKPKGCWYCTFQGQYVYTINPEDDKLMKAINHIRSIIKHTGPKFNKFALKPLTPTIIPYYMIYLGDNDQQTSGECTYISVLLELIVRFTESKYVNIQNPGIDLAACEVIEAIIRNISSIQLSNQIFSRNINDILNSLHFATVNEQHLLQIQILNLLKLIFFDSQIRKLADSKLLKNVIQSKLFINTILEGVNSSFPYIKQRFVQFINYSILLLLEYHTNSSQIISQILNTYTTKIAYINSKKIEISNAKDLQISQKNAEILILFNGIKQLLSYFLNLQIQPFEKSKNQSDTDSGIFSLYSWKSFVQLKIQPKLTESSRAKKVIEEVAKQIINQLQQLMNIMTSCWTISQLLPYYKLSIQGLSLFDYDQFYTFNKQLYMTVGRFETEETVQTFIVNFVRVMVNTYPSELINSLCNNWASAKSVDFKLKILEILNFSSIPIEYFYAIVCQCINQDKIGKKRRPGQLELEQSLQQDLLHLCQVFTHYNFQNFSVFQTNNLLSLWMAFMKFIKIFQNTGSVLTLYSLIELIDLFMKKNNPKEISKDERLKKEIVSINGILYDLISVCSGKVKIISEGKERVLFQQFLPLPSSVFDHYISKAANKPDQKGFYLFFKQISAAKAVEYCRIHGFFIAKRISYNLLACLYTDNQVMLLRKMRELVSQFLPIVQDKQQQSILVETASDVVLAMLQKKHGFMKQFKQDILQIFNKDDFFICSSRTLHTWARIIDLIIDNNKDHDIFQEYLQKVSLVSSLFSSYNLQTKKKIKSFERICFILYAGRKDKYNEKAHLLVDKIIEVIKNSDAPQPVLILVFFCIRILILRMSPEKLTKLLAGAWQMVIILLINIFGDSIELKNRLNLLWAALKLIQMISIMEIAEFHSHQWLFFYDFVGVRLYSGQSSNEQIKLNLRPKIHKFMSDSIRVYKEQIVTGDLQRHLIIKQDIIDDIQLLKTKGLLLSSYLISNNECRMKFNMQEIEELIDNDFLNLDEFIFKFK